MVDFGDALDYLKSGKSVARNGWSGANQFIYLVPGGEYDAQTNVARKEFGEKVPYGPYLAIKPVNDIVVPWLASQTDILADDWFVLV